MDSLRNVKAVILHLSDIHRTPDEAVTNAQILNGLIAALDDWIDAKRAPDIVVVSGDITQGAEPQEYDEARAFLEGLLNHLELDPTRLGNLCKSVMSRFGNLYGKPRSDR